MTVSRFVLGFYRSEEHAEEALHEAKKKHFRRSAVVSRRTFFWSPNPSHRKPDQPDDENFSESEALSRDVREVEAVALLCCESLGLPGAEYSRGYIQSGNYGQPLRERSAQRIFSAADQILRAGRRSDTP